MRVSDCVSVGSIVFDIEVMLIKRWLCLLDFVSWLF